DVCLCAFLIALVELELHPSLLARAPFRSLVERNVWPASLGVVQDHPATLDGLCMHVVESFPPERQHLVELIATDDDRADLQFARHRLYERVPSAKSTASRGVKARPVVRIRPSLRGASSVCFSSMNHP